MAERELYKRHGTKEEHIQLSADEVLEAIAKGMNIDVEYADIAGDLDIGRIADRLKKNEDGRYVIEGDVNICSSNINGHTCFGMAQFNSYVYFVGTRFIGRAGFSRAQFRDRAYFLYTQFISRTDFNSAQFRGNALFDSAQFGNRAYFDSDQFSDDANFTGAIMITPANFYGVTFTENTVRKRLWDYILRPIVWLVTAGRIKLKKKPITDFSGFNTSTVMDGSTNPYLKRYIDDQQWVASWRQRSWLRRWPLFLLWEVMSHCGRSFGLWAFWSVLFAFVFGLLYRGHVWIDSCTANNWYTTFYFSVVTFTTLGFGDIKPIDALGQLWVTLEVVLGYVMLGGLISIFANKFARRS